MISVVLLVFVDYQYRYLEYDLSVISVLMKMKRGGKIDTY